MPAFHRPATLAEACTLMSSLSQPLAYGGGTAIQLLAVRGELTCSDLVDLTGLPGAGTISALPGGLRVGAAVTIRRMERDPAVRSALPVAAQACARVAHPRIRNVATVGGNLALADPRLDPPGALAVLGACAELASAAGTRRVPVRDFFPGPGRSACRPGEVITALEIPRQPPGAGGAFVKYTSLSESDWPCASAAALVVPAAGGHREVRAGLGAAAPVPVFAQFPLPAGVTARDAAAAAREVAAPLIDPVPDVRGGAAYKRHLALLALAGAVTAAWEEASVKEAAHRKAGQDDGC